jgi:hypothetical protein
LKELELLRLKNVLKNVKLQIAVNATLLITENVELESAKIVTGKMQEFANPAQQIAKPVLQMELFAQYVKMAKC